MHPKAFLSRIHHQIMPALQDTRVGNLGVTPGLTVLGASGFDRLDNSVGLGVAPHNLAKDDVLSVEPVSCNGGNEELGSVARVKLLAG
jgi:hypothetical protein